MSFDERSGLAVLVDGVDIHLFVATLPYQEPPDWAETMFRIVRSPGVFAAVAVIPQPSGPAHFNIIEAVITHGFRISHCLHNAGPHALVNPAMAYTRYSRWYSNSPTEYYAKS